MRFHRAGGGFTIVEVLVVVAIVALIGTGVNVAVSGSKNKSHDVQRTGDMEQVKVALRTYRDEYSTSTYPSYPNGDLIGDGVGIDTLLAPYMTGTLRDPVNSGSYRYYYDSDYDSCGTTQNRVVVLAQTMGRSGAGNYASVCGVTAGDMGNGVTPTADSYILILK